MNRVTCVRSRSARRRAMSGPEVTSAARGEGNRIGSRAFAERWLRRPGRDRGSAARLDRTGRARVRPRGVDARERERAQPASAAPSRRASRAMSEALGTDEGCRPVRETSPGDFHVHDRLDPTALVDAVALHAARDAKRHAVRRMARAAVSREVARRAGSSVRSRRTPRSTSRDLPSLQLIKMHRDTVRDRTRSAPSLRRSLRESQLLPEEHRRGAQDGHHGADHRARGDGLVVDHLPSGNA